MNALRLGLSLLMVSFPALALPAVRRTRRPRAWAVVIVLSLGAGFVLVEASLIHSSLPLVLTLLGMDELAAACRAYGGHLFGAAPPFCVFAGLMAIVVAVRAVNGSAGALRAQLMIRRTVTHGDKSPIGGYDTVFLPMSGRSALALPGAHPYILLSTSLMSSLRIRELTAVVRHEVAHLRHHHMRFLLLGTAVQKGLWFLPWMRRGTIALSLALERWADEEVSSESEEGRREVRSALAKLARLTPSALAGDRLRALDEPGSQVGATGAWGWPTAASAILPLALGLGLTLVAHLVRIVHLAASTGG